MGAFNLGDIFVTIKARTEDLKKGLDGSVKAVNSASDKMGQGFKAAEAGSFALLGAVTMVAGATVLFGKQSVDAYFAAAEASSKLKTNMLNVKGATMQQVGALEDLASALQRKGVIEDDAIKAGMSQLATFNLQSKTIATLTPKIADMVAQLKGHNATAEDMVGINNLVGKVMTGNVGALSRYGVTLDDNQKKMLENGNETQRAAVLNQVLAQNYGKVNEQLRKTPQGRITGLKNAFGDLQENVGEFIINGLGPVIDGFAGWVSKMEEAGGILPYLKNLIKENQSVLTVLATILGLGLLPALVAVAGAVWGLLAPLTPFLIAGAAIGLMVDDQVKKMGGWHVVLDKVKDAYGRVKAVIEMLVTGNFDRKIGKALGVSEDDPLVDKVFTLREGIIELANGIKNYLVAAGQILIGVIQFLMPSLISLWDTFKNKLLPSLVELWNALAPTLVPILKVLAVVLGATLVGALWLFINGLRIAIDFLSSFIKYSIAVTDGVVKAFTFAANSIIAPYRYAFNMIAKMWNATVGQMTFKAPDWVPGMGGKSFGVPKIPQFSRGVQNFEGGLAFVHKDEALVNLSPGTSVIPANKVGSMGGVTIEKIIINDRNDADYLMAKLGRNFELGQSGMASRAGSVGV